jgi:hypothetical protein
MCRQPGWSVAAICALVAGCAALGESAVTRASGMEATLKAGIWGSRVAMLTVAENEAATLELLCAHGTIPWPLTIAPDGKVEWSGWLTREAGGAGETQNAGEKVAVRYRGALADDTLTLDIVTSGDTVQGRLTLVYGNRFSIAKCQ